MTRRRRQLLNTAEDHRDTRDLDNIAHFEPRRETVGELLRRTRDIKGSELEAVATRLRIRPGYLRAIESGRFQDLPGSTYAVGFVRTYADHLGLDSEDVVRRFRDEVAEVNNQTQLIFPVVAAEGKIPRGAILLVSAVLGAIAYGGWYYLSERDQSPLDLIPELPGQLRSLISGEETLPGASDPAPHPAAEQPAGHDTAAVPQPGSAPEVSPESAPAAAIPPAEAPESVATASADPAPATDAALAADASADATADPAVPAAPSTQADPAAEAAAQSPAATSSAPDAQIAAVPPPSVPAPALPQPGEAAPSAAPTLDSSGLPTVAAPTTGNIPGVTPPADSAALPPAAEGQVFGATDAPSRIVLVARLESWVQVTDPETNALLTRVLRAGDRYYVPDQAGLTLATGNAGGLDVWVDGRKLPALGPVGVVRRGIALDPQRLSSGTAISDTPPID